MAAGAQELTGLRTGKYYDMVGPGIYPIGMYSVAARLNATDGATYPNGIAYSPYGGGVKACNSGNSAAYIERPFGIAAASCRHNDQCPFWVHPAYQFVMASGAVARGDLLCVNLQEQKIDSAAPAVNLADMRLPVDPTLNLTYSLSMVGTQTVTPTTGSGTNSLSVYNVGYAETATTNKYDLVICEFDPFPFYY